MAAAAGTSVEKAKSSKQSLPSFSIGIEPLPRHANEIDPRPRATWHHNHPLDRRAVLAIEPHFDCHGFMVDRRIAGDIAAQLSLQTIAFRIEKQLPKLHPTIFCGTFLHLHRSESPPSN